MKLMSFVRGGKPGWGVAVEEGVIDLTRALGGKYPSLRALLAGDGLAEAAEAADGAKPDAGLKEIEFLPVIPDPEKILCIGLNYKTHIAETGRGDSDYPVIFSRYADTQTGHLQAMVRPNNSTSFDYEGELAVIIGKAGRHIAEEDALGHIAGYACYNDGSVRDWQRHTHQFLPGKNFPKTGGFGPWMVTADEIPDPASMTLVTRLNGEEMQRSGTDMLIFTVPFLIHYLSSFTELRPGDVISTGTPGGVGFKRKPPVFMKEGDTIEVEIDKIGTLTNPIADEG